QRQMCIRDRIKNVLIFAPMVAAHAFSGATAMQAGLAFVAFALVASGVYVLNDLLDLGPDRAHPRKRNRPVASGALPIAHASLMVPGLLGAGFGVASLLGWAFALVVAGYLVATTAYSMWLKRRIVADIATLAGLYTLRIVAGGVATGITLSVWLLALSIFLFFALAAVKRQAELVDAAERGLSNTSGRGYRVDDLPLVAQMATSAGFVAVLVLALYIDSPQVQAQYDRPAVLWGVCLVLLYWVARIVMVTHRGRMHDDPLVFAIKDPISRTCLVVTGALFAAATFL
ncbi:UbiA family prenyltransferase, partial [Sediminimonas sp.]|uniref:UbiA family prenyltransferase n=1 Tax=Sediminimonas sp. TaxID=2823379 RepID=UPI0025D21664